MTPKRHSPTPPCKAPYAYKRRPEGSALLSPYRLDLETRLALLRARKAGTMTAAERSEAQRLAAILRSIRAL